MNPCRSDCPQGDCANCVDFGRPGACRALARRSPLLDDRIVGRLLARGPMPAVVLLALLASDGDAGVDMPQLYTRLVHLEARGRVHVESHAGSADWALGPTRRAIAEAAC